jgi:hypothetical protein
VPEPADLPTQVILAVFDFPERGSDTGHEPSLTVGWISGRS